MAYCIPSDPSLYLGSIVPKDKWDILSQMAAEQELINDASYNLNTTIALRKELGRVAEDLIAINLDVNDVKSKIEEIGQKIIEYSMAYGSAQIKGLVNIAELKKKLQEPNQLAGNLIDFSKSKLITLPLSYDSLKLDTRYFSGASNTEEIKDFASVVLNKVDEKTKQETSNIILNTIANQREVYGIEGTLIISANCTHKASTIIDPFEIDIDKAISVWNETMSNPIDINKIDYEMLAKGGDDKEFLEVVSGANYGSSFIGMVHTVRDSSKNVNNKELDKEKKELLGRQKVLSHINLIILGNLVTLKSHKIDLRFKEVARTKNEQIDGLLQDFSDETNKNEETQIMDIKSLLNAFEEYITNILKSSFQFSAGRQTVGMPIPVGMPISFYTKRITRNDIIKKILLRNKNELKSMMQDKQVDQSVKADDKNNNNNNK